MWHSRAKTKRIGSCAGSFRFIRKADSFWPGGLHVKRYIRGLPVAEGVKFATKDRCAIAVRKENGDIALRVMPAESFRRFSAIPFLRGAERLIAGISGLLLAISQSQDMPAQEMVKPLRLGKMQLRSHALLAWLAGIWSVALIALCLVLSPWLVRIALTQWTTMNANDAGALACIVRAIMFLPMVRWLCLMRFVRRLAMHHGACHKALNCLLSGKALTMENALLCPRLTGRSDAAFSLAVAFASLLLCGFVRMDTAFLLGTVVLRLALMLGIAMVLGEICRYAHRKDGTLCRLIRLPAMALEELTTLEPHTEMLEVALLAMNTAIGKTNSSKNLRRGIA